MTTLNFLENSVIFFKISHLETCRIEKFQKNHTGIIFPTTPLTETQLTLMVENAICPQKIASCRLEKGRCPLSCVGEQDSSQWKARLPHASVGDLLGQTDLLLTGDEYTDRPGAGIGRRATLGVVVHLTGIQRQTFVTGRPTGLAEFHLM